MCVGVDGKWKVCCKSMDSYRPSVETTTFEEYRSSPQYQQIVETMKTKWHPSCMNCKQMEDTGIRQSLRMYANKTYSSDPGIESIEFSLSNDCNFRCRMCGPKFSNKWIDLIQDYPNLIKTQKHDKFDIFDIQEINVNVEDVLEGVDLSKIKTIKYLGGEPFISPKITRLFQYLEEKGVIGNIEFVVNTNCTFFPEKLVPYLLKFKNLIICLSIDGYGELNDYIRDGKIRWKTVEEVTGEWAKFSWNSNTNLIITPTVQAYNIHDVYNIKKFAKKYDIKFKTQNLVRPRYLSLNALPPEYLESVKNAENFEDIESAKFNPTFWKDFKEFTLDIDIAMEKSIKDYIPELYKYF
ncbi:AslB Arylsulfatase regulator (Fe-S oxidoreductase) [uncultured Caudovirales phage]|uniref:AslB Arylsulfatase regulator (Fe-S oxidoreductase) n=1 Tax=uncultured Caudovirales phage TaxID=2100421 RepID=A0A6J7WVC9_9CAUD|nr:AslB Arylsulfatase regulator (Fe-S oxidoreductase) [uncultured Caudovirales phage]